MGTPASASRAPFILAFCVALVLVGGSAAGLRFAVSHLKLYLSKKPIYAARKVHAIPTQTPRWEQVGQDEQMSDAMVEELDTSNYLSRHYKRRSDGLLVDLHLAYYTGMVDTVPHVPERCMIGGGWQEGSSAAVTPLGLDVSGWLPDPFAPEGTEPVRTARLANDPRYTNSPGATVRLPVGVEDLRMRVQDFTIEDHSMFVGYFFVANGKTLASANAVREEAFNLRSDYAFYLKVQISTPGVESSEEFVGVARDLLQDLLPEIMRCVPDWVEVEAETYEHPGEPTARLAPGLNEQQIGRSGRWPLA